MQRKAMSKYYEGLVIFCIWLDEIESKGSNDGEGKVKHKEKDEQKDKYKDKGGTINLSKS
jgi:hypothetical protein